MSSIDQIKDTLNLEEQDMKGLPTMLNVLTILTYIGSGFGILSAIYGYFTNCKTAEQLAEQELPEIGGFFGKIMNESLDTIMKQCDNRLVILIATLVTSVLCILGAAMMRNRKQQGFIIYTAGELLGPLAMALILGFSGMMILGFIFPVIFIILYATQRKYLVI